MKRLFLFTVLGGLIMSAMLSVAHAKSASLYDCYQSQGEKWGTVYERAPKAAQYGIWQYKGLATQNKLFAQRMCNLDENGEKLLGTGFSVATGYEKNLRTSMSSAQDYVPVTSFLLKDSTTLSISDLGNKIFLTIEPGATREEIVMCTTQDLVGIDWETCTRGLAFSGTSTTAVAANKKTHAAGSKVVMSNVHYVYEQFVDTNGKDQTISGAKTYTGTNTFYSFPIVSSTGYTGLPTQNGQTATKYYVDQVGAGGFTASNIAANEGLRVLGTSPETAGVYVRADKGMVTSTTGIYQNIDSSTGLTQGASGIGLSTSTLVSQIATSTPTANMIPIANASGTISNPWLNFDVPKFGGDGSDGALDTSGGVVNIDIASSSYVVKNYTSINIASNALTFTNPPVEGTVVVLKSTGNCVISNTIMATGIGAINGTGGTGSSASGISGSSSLSFAAFTSQGQVIGGSGGANNAAGGGGGTQSFKLTSNYISTLLSPGNGGGGGGSGDSANATGGAGGRGGGAIYIECAGSLNFTGTITVAGSNGSNGVAGTSNGGGGGGGGSAGSVIINYNTLLSRSGTVTVTGGTGGNGGNGAGGNEGGSGGGGGGSSVSAGGAGGAAGAGASASGSAATIGGSGGNAGGSTAAGGGGGGGASGWYSILQYLNPAST